LNNKLSLLCLDKSYRTALDYADNHLKENALYLIRKLEHIFIVNNFQEFFDYFKIIKCSGIDRLYLEGYYLNGSMTICIAKEFPEQGYFNISINKTNVYYNGTTYRFDFCFPWIFTHEQEFIKEIKYILKKIDEVNQHEQPANPV